MKLENHNLHIDHTKKWKVSKESHKLLVSPSGDIWEIINGKEAGEQLFTWDAAMREAKKQGKRIPTNEEMDELMKKKKDIPSLVLTGYRDTNSTFYGRGVDTDLWSSTEAGSNAWKRGLYSGHATVRRYTDNKGYGFAVRCLKPSTKKVMELLSEKKWIPAMSGKFWKIYCLEDVCFSHRNSSTRKEELNSNCFRTKKEALEKLKAINEILKS